MKVEFLHENADSKDVIVFFAGFASLPQHFAHLKSKKNVAFFYDYTSFDFSFDFKAFQRLDLIAFSMGVAVASRLLKAIHFQRKIAINGTNFGIDRTRGIHPTLFAKSIKYFNKEYFERNLFGKYKNEHLRLDNEEKLMQELHSLYDFINKTKPEVNFTWDTVFMSKEDAIFPNLSLENCFNEICLLYEPHFAFFAFKNWDFYE